MRWGHTLAACGALGGYGDSLLLPPPPDEPPSDGDADADADADAAAAEQRAAAAAEQRAIAARAARLTVGGGAMVRRVVGLALLARARAPPHAACAALVGALGFGCVVHGWPGLGMLLELGAALVACNELQALTERDGHDDDDHPVRRSAAALARALRAVCRKEGCFGGLAHTSSGDRVE